jgi:hypothetical protein
MRAHSQANVRNTDLADKVDYNYNAKSFVSRWEGIQAYRQSLDHSQWRVQNEFPFVVISASLFD